MLCTVLDADANSQGLDWVPEILGPGVDWVTKVFHLEKQNEVALAEFKKVSTHFSVLTDRYLQNPLKHTKRTFCANQGRLVAA
jgi:hypothetical protein